MVVVVHGCEVEKEDFEWAKRDEQKHIDSAFLQDKGIVLYVALIFFRVSTYLLITTTPLLRLARRHVIRDEEGRDGKWKS